MGQRQDKDEIVYGNPCPIGFPDGDTPKYLYVRFSQIIKCPDWPPTFFETPPNDHAFKLTQSETYACVWQVTTTDWNVVVDLQFNPTKIIFWLEHMPDGRVYFYSLTDTPLVEGKAYHNENLDCGIGYASVGGFATVTWRLQTLKVMGLLNIKTAKDLFMELRPRKDGKLVYKFCRLQDATNIAIEFEP